MKKKLLVLATATAAAAVLAGCGTNFSLSSSDLEAYADVYDGIYTDVSEDYIYDYDGIDGVYVMESGTVHVELWDNTDASYAASWYSSNKADLEAASVSHKGSSDSKSGDYTYTMSDGVVYRIMYCDDLGIYAHGESAEELDSVLAGLNLVK